jgi:hypothetical protein
MKIARLIASLLIFGLLFGLSSAKVSAQPFGCPPGYDLNSPEVSKVVGATTYVWHAEKKFISKEGYTETITTPGYYTKAKNWATIPNYNSDANIWHAEEIEYVWHEAEFLTEPGYYTSSATSGYYAYDISGLHKVWALKATTLGHYKHIFVLGGFDEAGTWVLARWGYFWVPGDIVQEWLP